MYIIIAVNSGKKDGMSVFTGAGVAIITPMKANGEVNYDKLGEFLDYQINNSTDAIIICGTTGEASTLTHEEHVETIRFAADYVKKRVPVIAGTGSNCTETAVWLSQEAQKAGVDGCLVVTPYYNKATQKGLIQHYTAVAKSVDFLSLCIMFLEEQAAISSQRQQPSLLRMLTISLLLKLQQVILHRRARQWH